MNKNLQVLVSIVFLAYFLAQAFLWLIAERPFSWPMFAVWVIMGFLGLLFGLPDRSGRS